MQFTSYVDKLHECTRTDACMDAGKQNVAVTVLMAVDASDFIIYQQ